MSPTSYLTAPPRDKPLDKGEGLILRGQDLNLRPSGYEPDELPDCSTPRHGVGNVGAVLRCVKPFFNSAVFF
jgi:hypothetical protein